MDSLRHEAIEAEFPELKLLLRLVSVFTFIFNFALILHATKLHYVTQNQYIRI